MACSADVHDSLVVDLNTVPGSDGSKVSKPECEPARGEARDPSKRPSGQSSSDPSDQSDCMFSSGLPSCLCDLFSLLLTCVQIDMLLMSMDTDHDYPCLI